MPDIGDVSFDGTLHEAVIVGISQFSDFRNAITIDLCARNSIGNPYIRYQVPLIERPQIDGPYATYEKPAPTPPPTAETRLTVYEHDNFVGGSLTMTSALDNFAPMGFNDKASSAVIEGGPWEAFEHANYGGKRVELAVGNHPSLRQFNFNDMMSSARPVVPPVVVPAGPRYFGYFYSDDPQVAQTADHVNLIHIPSAGPEWWPTPQAIIDTAINRLNLARAAGITKAVLTMDFCGFRATGMRRTYLGTTRSRINTQFYLSQIESNGLSDMIIGLYTVDEPERDAQVPADDLASFCDDLRVVSAEFNIAPSLAVIYGDGGGGWPQDYVAIGSHDWVGRNAYNEGEGALGAPFDDLKARLGPNQRMMLIPGCSRPWVADPNPWYDKMMAEPVVCWLCPFMWVGSDGLGNNPGLQPAYRTVGQAIKNI
jgi:hypothetical protein